RTTSAAVAAPARSPASPARRRASTRCCTAPTRPGTAQPARSRTVHSKTISRSRIGMPFMRWLACAFLLTACGDDTSGHPPPQPGPHVIFIDIDDHGLAALWDSSSPNLQRMAREGAFAYSRADLPTHSNQSNFTLLTGAWPEVTDVPHNPWLDRMRGYQQPCNIGAVSAGSYIYYDQNPLAGRVQSIYTAAHAAGLRSTYVGLLPPFERGADEVHFTVYQAKLF